MIKADGAQGELCRNLEWTGVYIGTQGTQEQKEKFCDDFESFDGLPGASNVENDGDW